VLKVDIIDVDVLVIVLVLRVDVIDVDVLVTILVLGVDVINVDVFVTILVLRVDVIDVDVAVLVLVVDIFWLRIAHVVGNVLVSLKLSATRLDPLPMETSNLTSVLAN
jgi:hypothetical protein